MTWVVARDAGARAMSRRDDVDGGTWSGRRVGWAVSRSAATRTMTSSLVIGGDDDGVVVVDGLFVGGGGVVVVLVEIEPSIENWLLPIIEPRISHLFFFLKENLEIIN